ncbi:hypothetical protein [Clostridium oceanicum]|uniref:DUF3953 domain-containing protein n=1 Tax=Clostridium oceanicum TaxID=1543 RepID=A0ABN1JN03_9CLOT
MKNNKKSTQSYLQLFQIILGVLILVMAFAIIFNNSINYIGKFKFNNIILVLLVVLNVLSGINEFKFKKDKAKGYFYFMIGAVMLALLIISLVIIK